jgi:hypothetical protein
MSYPELTVREPSSKRIIQGNAVDIQTNEGIFVNGVPQTFYFEGYIPCGNIQGYTQFKIRARISCGLIFIELLEGSPKLDFYPVANANQYITFNLPVYFAPKTPQYLYMDCRCGGIGYHGLLLCTVNTDGLITLLPVKPKDTFVFEQGSWSINYPPELKITLCYMQ